MNLTHHANFMDNLKEPVLVNMTHFPKCSCIPFYPYYVLNFEPLSNPHPIKFWISLQTK